MRKTTIPSRYWSKMVNSLGVTHLEQHWSLAHYPVFCLFCTLSSDCGHVPAPSVYSIKSDIFFLPLRVSPLIKMLDGRDVSLSLTFAGFLFFSISLPGKESHTSHACSWTRAISVFNLVIFSQEFYCFSTSIWLNFTFILIRFRSAHFSLSKLSRCPVR